MTAGGDTGGRIIGGKALATGIPAGTRSEPAAIRAERGSGPKVRVVPCGDDQASATYARRMIEASSA